MTRVAIFVVALCAAATGARAGDQRVVVDVNAPPWAAVAKVQTNTGVHCTGVLIAPATVLTAAHCLYNRRTGALLQPLSLHVLFGYQRGRYRSHRLVARTVIGPGFNGARPGPQAADWARLTLAASVPTQPLPWFSGRLAPGLAVALAGYNQDRDQVLIADLACAVVRVVGMPNARFVEHDCAATRGTSGAPLLTRVAHGWAIVGINIAAGSADNLALVPPRGP